jgi:photosystem I P700 chlorophyll a apoprotein A1
MSDDVASTTWLWSLHADAHDFPNQVALNGLVASRIFATHFGHISIVAAWLSASLFGGARYSNYMAWLADPLSVKPTAQIVYAGANHIQDVLNGDVGANSAGIRVTSGVFSVWRASGLTSSEQLFTVSLAFCVAALAFLVAGWYHHHRAVPTSAWFNDVDAILTHHLTAVIGLGSLAWAGHLVHVSVPTDALLRLGMDPVCLGAGTRPLIPIVQEVALGSGGAGFLALDWRGLGSLVTWWGGCNPATGSLWLSDVVHHHLALGTVALLAGHMYRTQFSIGTGIHSLLLAHRAVFMNSWHAQLAINLGVLGTGSILLGHILLAFPAYPFLCMDWAAELSLFTHHAWIGGFFIVGSGSHAALFLIVDYRVGTLRGVERLLVHRHSLTAHLNWVCIFLG